MAILPFGLRGKTRDSNRADRFAAVQDQRIRAAFELAPVGLAVATLDGRGVRKNAAAGVRQLTRVAPYFPAAMEYLAAHYAKNGRLALAKKWAARAVRRGEDSARLWLAEINRRAKRA